MDTYTEQVLEALGAPTRRSVFKRLRRGALSVGEISKGMDVSRPAVSQHLKVLKEVRPVVDRAEGTRRLYVVDTRGLDALRRWLDGFWDETLAAFKRAAEVFQDAADQTRLGDEGDHAHDASAAGTDERIDLVHPSDELRPSAA